MRSAVSLLLLLTAFAGALQAQNRSVQALPVAELDWAKFPSAVDAMAFEDGMLHVSSASMLFALRENEGVLSDLHIDTVMTAVDRSMCYMARNPLSGILYFSKAEEDGRLFLYEYYERKPGRWAVRHVKPSGFSYSIEHPAFSEDGLFLVFASDCPLGLGGKDLWYSTWNGTEWRYPLLLDSLVSGEGDEVMPRFYGDYLLFSASGRDDSRGGLDLYAVRVFVDQPEDSISAPKLLCGAVSSLEEPFCSSSDDYALTLNAKKDGGWWISTNGVGVSTLHAFSGRLNAVSVSGVVSDAQGAPVPGAAVTLLDDGHQMVSTLTDRKGRYRILLQPYRSYTLRVSAPHFFVSERTLSCPRTRNDKIFDESVVNCVLSSFMLDTEYEFTDLFNSAVGSELSPAGRTRLHTIARFLSDNPDLKLRLETVFMDGGDVAFCRLVSEARIQTLLKFLSEQGIPSAAVSTSMLLPQPKVAPVAAPHTPVDPLMAAVSAEESDDPLTEEATSPSESEQQEASAQEPQQREASVQELQQTENELPDSEEATRPQSVVFTFSE